MGGGGEEGRPVTSHASGDKAPGSRSSEDTAPGAEWAVRSGTLAAAPPEQGSARRHHAPKRGPARAGALGLQTLGGHRLQPAFGHHQGRCFPSFGCKSGTLGAASPLGRGARPVSHWGVVGWVLASVHRSRDGGISANKVRGMRSG